jgi:hypothetical protein
MNYRKTLKVSLLFLIFNIFIPHSQASVKFYQSCKINNNGSILMNFTYSANISEIKKGNNLIGNLPFSNETVKEYFSFQGGAIKKTAIYKDPSDPNITGVSIDILASDYVNITKAKALNGINLGWMKKDTGTVFSWLVLPSFLDNNSVDTYQFLLSTEGDIKSTNGLVKDNTCNWYIYRGKIDPKGAYFLATLKLDQSLASPQDTSKNNNSGKSCGLFGLELPILLLGGFVISKQLKKKK